MKRVKDGSESESSSTDDEEVGDGESKKSEKPKIVNEKWTNRERVLILCSRGTSYRDRHLMNDFKTLMPHSKSESKYDKKHGLANMNEICEMKNCNKCVYFETRKSKDLYLWLANINRGPSVKFLVQNVHTTGELKLSGNCLKASRPILSFDKTFDENAHFALLKELFLQIFSTPNHHPRSQPFIDHVLNFSVEDNRIWFRNYQIVDEASAKLEEIGPRMVLQVIKIFEGSFGGPLLYENPSYICPNTIRRVKKLENSDKYNNKVLARTDLLERRQNEPDTYRVDKTAEDVFDTNRPEATIKINDAEMPADVAKLKRQLEIKRKRIRNRKKQKTA